MVKSPLDLTIVIVNYNGQYWLKKTLSSLDQFYLQKTKRQVKVVVVDNGSTDGSPDMVQQEFGWVELVGSSENIGFAAGNNLALKQVTSTYVMLLNSDMELTTESEFDTLLDYLDQHHKVAVITPAIRLVSGQLDPACHRGEPSLWASFTYFAGLEKIFPHSELFGQYHQWFKDTNQIHTIDACSGATMIVRTSAMNKVGLLDEQFFMYAEDLDWCKRFREAGYDIIFHPGVSIIHHKYKSGQGSSDTQTAKKTSLHFYDTMLQYYDKHYHTEYPSVVRSIIQYILHFKKGVQ